MKKAHFTNRAFTLIELLVVIAIIAILTGIILTSLTGSKAKGRDAQRVSDIGQIQLALELYFDRCHQYPSPDTSQPGGGSYIDYITLMQNAGCPSGSNITFGSYITQVMVPPAGAGQKYYDYYVNFATPTDYILHAKLEAQNSAQQNSLPESLVATGGADYSWASSISCYNSANSSSVDYCVGPK